MEKITDVFPVILFLSEDCLQGMKVDQEIKGRQDMPRMRMNE